MSTTKTRFVAAVLDTSHLKLYKEDGSTILIPQGDSRIRPILADATPQITANGFVDLDVEQYTPENAFVAFEKKSGITRFFKVAKETLSKFFSSNEPMEPVAVGTIPGINKPSKEEKISRAVEEILKYAVPATDPNFSEQGVLKQRPLVTESGITPSRDNLKEEEEHPSTMIAVINNKIVPGVEKVKNQITRAASVESTKGMDAFLSRCASVAGIRKHSVDDLLRFLERGDLPIAEDGSILIYKVLRKKGNHYVDCHTQKVPQKVGSYVCMDESLVDPNRRNECSNGLHVARRGYVGGFDGDVCVMAKLAPEDVIAVPEYDANKMRVCGYHIIFELTQPMFDLLKANKPITSLEEGKILLARAMAGEHIGVIEEVRITQQNGGGIVVTPRDATKPKKVEQPPAVIEQAVALNDEHSVVAAPPVNPKEVVQEVIALSRKDMAKGLYDTFQRATDTQEKATALQALVDFKKQCKVSWEKLGISDPTGPTNTPTKPVKAKEAPKPKKEVKKMMTPREEIQHLLPKFDAANGNEKTEFAKDILKLKQQAKKSWDVLGVPKATVEKILLRAK